MDGWMVYPLYYHNVPLLSACMLVGFGCEESNLPVHSSRVQVPFIFPLSFQNQIWLPKYEFRLEFGSATAVAASVDWALVPSFDCILSSPCSIFKFNSTLIGILKKRNYIEGWAITHALRFWKQWVKVNFANRKGLKKRISFDVQVGWVSFPLLLLFFFSFIVLFPVLGSEEIAIQAWLTKEKLKIEKKLLKIQKLFPI